MASILEDIRSGMNSIAFIISLITLFIILIFPLNLSPELAINVILFILISFFLTIIAGGIRRLEKMIGEIKERVSSELEKRSGEHEECRKEGKKPEPTGASALLVVLLVRA